MIELQNDNIAISNYNYPYKISIIDSKTKIIKKTIQDITLIPSNSSICEFNSETIICIWNGYFCIILINESKLIHKIKNFTWRGIGGIHVFNNKFLAFDIKENTTGVIEIINLNLESLLK